MRKGLSYLEVLIAAGIALIGMLGAIAILPVATMNMRRGQQVDVMAAIGPSALESVGAMHVPEPSWWMTSVGGAIVEVENPSYAPRPTFQGRKIHPAVQPYDALCFDPRYVAQVTTWDASQNDPTMFPAIPMETPLDARMRRMTLAGNSVGSPKPPMTTAHARLLFKSQDDLIFERPEGNLGGVSGETLPARQFFISGSTGANQRRDYMADFEFVITAMPTTEFEDRTGSPVYNRANVAFHSTGIYDIAAVVFNGRTPDLSTILTYNGDPSFTEEERLCNVAFFGAGYNGGDVTVSLRPGRPESDLNIVQSTWALVSGVQAVTRQAPPTAPPGSPPAIGQRPVFQWYRVTQFSELYGGNSRDLTLDGPDWFPNTSNLRITFVSGVVGVFTDRMTIK